MKNRIFFFITVLFLLNTSIHAKTIIYPVSQFGILPNTETNTSPLIRDVISKIANESKNGDKIIIQFAPGKYHFREEGSTEREYYISNHDQTNPKKVGIAIENMKNITIDGQGAEFIFHGRMLPVSLINSTNCSLKNFSIDFENPHICQVEIIKNTENGIEFETAPWVKAKINDNGKFMSYGESWTAVPFMGIAFEKRAKHILYRTSDIGINTSGTKQIGENTYKAPEWKDARLKPGTIVAMRTGERPTPGVFLSHSYNSKFKDIKVHYAEGMGLLAQLCENISLDGFSICLRGGNDPRYFTTQADATHFSGCKGKIISKNGIYENMMDDAINIHGTYLRVAKRIDEHTIVGEYMHSQSWGFDWGYTGDKVQFINSSTMEIIDRENEIADITPHDKKEIKGAKEFMIRFKYPIDPVINENYKYGIENLEWTPEVVFSDNLIRNNRARGTLFSTPKKTIVENNIFDHTSGSAILLCGDCNGWYETGACREVIIRNNKFINSLTSLFQFTDAIISIYPVIPDLENQKKYFHGGKGKSILIEKNEFDTFDIPLVYAKSVDGLTFRNNVIKQNSDYEAFHFNKHRFFFQKVNNPRIEKNVFDNGFDYSIDVRNE